jgi:hypothetical protein
MLQPSNFHPQGADPDDGTLKVETCRGLTLVLTYVSALFEFLSKLVTSVHGYEQDKV